MQENLFRKESLEHNQGGEKLDRCLTATRPSGWLLLVAFALIAVSLGIWGFMAEIPISYPVSGLVVNEKFIVTLPEKDAASLDTSTAVLIDGWPHEILSLSTATPSEYDLERLYGAADYSDISLNESSVLLVADAQGAPDGLCAASVITDTRHPVEDW